MTFTLKLTLLNFEMICIYVIVIYILQIFIYSHDHHKNQITIQSATALLSEMLQFVYLKTHQSCTAK